MSTNKKYIVAIIILALLVVFFGACLIGAYKEIHKPCENCKKLTKELKEATEIPETYGEIGRNLYTVEIWEDGTANVKTTQGYINELDDGLIIITNRHVIYKDGVARIY